MYKCEVRTLNTNKKWVNLTINARRAADIHLFKLDINASSFDPTRSRKSEQNKDKDKDTNSPFYGEDMSTQKCRRSKTNENHSKHTFSQHRKQKTGI